MTSLRAMAFASTLFASAVQSEAQEARERQPSLTIRLYNYAGIDERILERSRRVTGRVFDGIGFETAWLDCPVSPEGISANRACAERPPADHVVLNLLPREMSRKYGFRRGVFGFALPTAEGKPGNHVSLFFERVLDLAYHGGVGTSLEHGQAIILGHMMAHEVGHLLLGPESHGSRGVMSFPWGKRTLTRMERGLVRFTDAEAQRMQEELARREREQETLRYRVCVAGDGQRVSRLDGREIVTVPASPAATSRACRGRRLGRRGCFHLRGRSVFRSASR